ncbi:MAG TPA: phosphoenolpyruvate--protein phosphotransferase [Alphaproteobacteria bacterium]|nr:phosphoenolpyruvate--protein phosphotransferase [Alphaproteobacteria bacterium]
MTTRAKKSAGAGAERREGAQGSIITSREGERVFQGLGVSSGVAIGPAHVREAGALEVPEYAIAPQKLEVEHKRLAAAIERSKMQVHQLKAKAAALRGAAAEELGYLLDAHLQMLTGSRLVRGADQRIRRDHVNAEAAVQAEIHEIGKSFSQMDDAYFASRVDDIREVGARLVRNLLQKPYHAFSDLPLGSIVIAEELTPADTALLDPSRVGGFATVLGGPQSHTAIMARSLGLPAVLGVAGLMGGAEPGTIVVIDGTNGRVVVNPSAKTLAEYEERQRELLRERRQLSRLARLPAETRDGVQIVLQANVELTREVEHAREAGAEGIGLLRTEFLFMNREDLPDEEEQYRELKAFVEGMDGRPVTIRTLDIGGDKLALTLGDHFGQSANPALGLRAIRLSLKRVELIETQLAAMLRAGAHGPIRILLPMISSIAEVRQVKTIVKRVRARLIRQGAKIDVEPPKLGVMIEVPGAALAADALAMESDFFAIGTNDLTMYTLAIDRSDEQVAHLYNPLHPAVLRLIQFAAGSALRARIPLCLCGEIAGDPRYTSLLLGLGIRDFSMSVSALPRIKQRIRNLDLREATRRAELIMNQWDSGRIATLLDDFDALT